MEKETYLKREDQKASTESLNLFSKIDTLLTNLDGINANLTSIWDNTRKIYDFEVASKITNNKNEAQKQSEDLGLYSRIEDLIIFSETIREKSSTINVILNKLTE